MAETDNGRWVGSWGTPPTLMEAFALEGETVRHVVHISRGGDRFRLRLSNAYGSGMLDVGAVRVALSAGGSAIDPATDRAVTFHGADSISIAPGALAVSDPVEMPVAALADIAVSLHLPGGISEAFGVTGHANTCQTTWIADGGNATAETSLDGAETLNGIVVLNAVDVPADERTRGIVAIGDSLTISNISTVDANARWPDQLARRFADRDPQAMAGILNMGIGGNRIVHPSRGGSLQMRFDRDVLAQPGVTHAVVFLGINDIRNRGRKPEEEVTAEQLITGLAHLARRGQAAGIRVYGGTMLTYENENYNPPPGLPGLYTPEGEAVRVAVNDWIRTGGAFDAVVDFEEALRDPDHPTQMLPVYDCGDHLHPGDEGYKRMGDVIDMKLFD